MYSSVTSITSRLKDDSSIILVEKENLYADMFIDPTKHGQLLLVAGLVVGCAAPAGHPLSIYDGVALEHRAPEVCRVRLDTTKGSIVLEMQRQWAPHGVDRFYSLVRAAYYDEAAVFRLRAGVFAQFGIHGDPGVAKRWRARTIPDDARVLSNTRGTVAYAFKDPNGRTTQVFINLRDNSTTFDVEPFVPF